MLRNGTSESILRTVGLWQGPETIERWAGRGTVPGQGELWPHGGSHRTTGRSPSSGHPSRTAGLRGTVPGGLGCHLQRAPDACPAGHTLPPRSAEGVQLAFPCCRIPSRCFAGRKAVYLAASCPTLPTALTGLLCRASCRGASE